MLELIKVFKIKDLVEKDNMFRRLIVSKLISQLETKETYEFVENDRSIPSNMNGMIRAALEKSKNRLPELQDCWILSSHIGFMNTEDEEENPWDIMHIHCRLVDNKLVTVEKAPEGYELHRIFEVCIKYDLIFSQVQTLDIKLDIKFKDIEIEDEELINGMELAGLVEEELDELGYTDDDDDEYEDEDPVEDYKGFLPGELPLKDDTLT